MRRVCERTNEPRCENRYHYIGVCMCAFLHIFCPRFFFSELHLFPLSFGGTSNTDVLLLKFFGRNFFFVNFTQLFLLLFLKWSERMKNGKTEAVNKMRANEIAK